MRQDDYQIRLDAFQGPFDLLLYLIRRAEVDINDIPIARITDQYLAMLRQVDDVDIEHAGEFIVMSATLIEIKSRTLMPAEQRDEGQEGHGDDGNPQLDAADPRYELVQQLLAYQRYRLASEALDERRISFEQRFPVRAYRPQFDRYQESEREIELEDIHAMDLADAYERILEAVNFDLLGDHRVEFDDTPIELYEEDLLDRLARSDGRELSLHATFDGQRPPQRIGLFMAMLELTRMRRITVQQDDIDSDIVVRLCVDNDDEAIHVETDGINLWQRAHQTPPVEPPVEPPASSPVDPPRASPVDSAATSEDRCDEA